MGSRIALAAGVEVGFFRQVQDALHQFCHRLTDGRAGRQAGGLDAGAVHKAGGCFLEEEFMAQLMGAQPRKAGDGLPQRQVFHRQTRLGAHLVQLGGGGGGILLVVDVVGRGADEQIAVDGGGDQHPLAVFAGQLKNRVVHMVGGCVVQQEVVPPGGVQWSWYRSLT